MKKGLLAIATVLMLLLVPGAMALSSSIIVKTEPYHTGIIWVYNEDGKKIETFYILDPKTNLSGEVEFDYSTTLDTLTFEVIIKHPFTKEIVDEQTFRDVEVTNVIYLDLTDETSTEAPPEKSTEESVEETTEEPLEETLEEPIKTTEEPETEITITESKPSGLTDKITGFFVLEDTGKIAKRTYYMLGAIILIGLAIFIFLKRQTLNMKPAFMRKETFPDDSYLEAELKDAQQKIKEAQAEIRDIKRRGPQDKEIVKAQKEFEAAKAKLERIRSRKPTPTPVQTPTPQEAPKETPKETLRENPPAPEESREEERRD